MTITMKQLADADIDYAKELHDLAEAEKWNYAKILDMSLDEFLAFASNYIYNRLEVLEKCQKKQ